MPVRAHSICRVDPLSRAICKAPNPDLGHLFRTKNHQHSSNVDFNSNAHHMLYPQWKVQQLPAPFLLEARQLYVPKIVIFNSKGKT